MAKVTLKYQDGTTKVRHSRDEFRNEDEKLNAPVAIDYETVDELSLRDMNMLLSLMKAASEGSSKLMDLMEELEEEFKSTGEISEERQLEID